MMKTMLQSLLKIVQFLEYFCAKNHYLSSVYNKFFYKAIVAEEIKMATLNFSSKILHVGCGPYPFTAIQLAKNGFCIDAIDKDKHAAVSAQKIVNRLGLSDKITIINSDTSGVDIQKYDAIWVSLHAEPRDTLVADIISSMKTNSLLIYRNPHFFLKLFYNSYYPDISHIKSSTHLGKESIMIKKTEKTNRVSLRLLEPGKSATIVSVPDLPILSTLGYRPGKLVKVKVRGMLNGPIIAEVEGRATALTRAIADVIEVIPFDEPA